MFSRKLVKHFQHGSHREDKEVEYRVELPGWLMYVIAGGWLALVFGILNELARR